MSKVIVYSQNQCAYCGMVKRYLGAKQVAYEEVNLDEKPELREYVQKISGASTVPVVVVDKEDGTNPSLSIGWNPAGLNAALASLNSAMAA
jgi:glutaredoxin 3